MEKGLIKIYKKDADGLDDGYKTFSVRVKMATVVSLDALARESNRSRNELINFFLDYGVENAMVFEEKEPDKSG